MDDRDLRRLSRQFWHRHRPTWGFVREHDPGLWADAWETLQEAGAVVREFPAMRDSSTQAQTLRVHHRGMQTSPTHTREVRAHSGGTQTTPVPTREIGTQTEEEGRRTSPGRVASPANGCWNCGSPSHGYAACSQPRREPFCFGCGERGATVRTCRRCGPVYERTEPHLAPRGPRDRSRLTGGMTTRGSPY